MALFPCTTSNSGSPFAATGMGQQYHFSSLLNSSQNPVSSEVYGVSYTPAAPTTSAPVARSFGQLIRQPVDDLWSNGNGSNDHSTPRRFPRSFAYPGVIRVSDAAEFFNYSSDGTVIPNNTNAAEAARTLAPPMGTGSWGNSEGSFYNNHGFQPPPSAPSVFPGPSTPGTQATTTFHQHHANSSAAGHDDTPGGGAGTPVTPNNPYTPMPTTPRWGSGNQALLGICADVGTTLDSSCHGQDLEMPQPDMTVSDIPMCDLVRVGSQYETARIHQIGIPDTIASVSGSHRIQSGDGGLGGSWAYLEPQPRRHRPSITASDNCAVGKVAPLDAMRHGPAPRSAPVSIGEPPSAYQVGIQTHIQQTHGSPSRGRKRQHNREQQQQQPRHQPEPPDALSANPARQNKRRRVRAKAGGTGTAGNSIAVAVGDDCAAERANKPPQTCPRSSPACMLCYLSQRPCDHESPCGRCQNSKDKLPCVENRQWKSLENIFRNCLRAELKATVDAILRNKSLLHLQVDKALEKHIGRPIALKAALDVLSVAKFGHRLSYAACFEGRSVQRQHTIFDTFYQTCLVLQSRSILENSGKFVYTQQFDDDMRMLLALSTARALGFFEENLEKNKRYKKAPTGHRAHDLVVFLAIMLEQTRDFADLVPQALASGLASISEAEAQTELGKQHRQLMYHLAYYLRKMLINVFDKKKGAALDPAAGASANAATGNGRAAKKGKAVDEKSEQKIDRHLHIGPDTDVYLKPTFWGLLSKLISRDNLETEGKGKGKGKGKATAQDEYCDDDESFHSEEEQDVGMGAFHYGHPGPWAGSAAEGFAGPSTLMARFGEDQSSRADASTVPKQPVRRQPSINSDNSFKYDSDGLLEIRTQADALLDEDLLRSFQDMHVQPDSQTGQTVPTNADTEDSNREAQVKYSCGYYDEFSVWIPTGSPHSLLSDAGQRKKSGAGVSDEDGVWAGTSADITAAAPAAATTTTNTYTDYDAAFDDFFFQNEFHSDSAGADELDGNYLSTTDCLGYVS